MIMSRKSRNHNCMKKNSHHPMIFLTDSPKRSRFSYRIILLHPLALLGNFSQRGYCGGDCTKEDFDRRRAVELKHGRRQWDPGRFAPNDGLGMSRKHLFDFGKVALVFCWPLTLFLWFFMDIYACAAIYLDKAIPASWQSTKKYRMSIRSKWYDVVLWG